MHISWPSQATFNLTQTPKAWTWPKSDPSLANAGRLSHSQSTWKYDFLAVSVILTKQSAATLPHHTWNNAATTTWKNHQLTFYYYFTPRCLSRHTVSFPSVTPHYLLYPLDTITHRIIFDILLLASSLPSPLSPLPVPLPYSPPLSIPVLPLIRYKLITRCQGKHDTNLFISRWS